MSFFKKAETDVEAIVKAVYLDVIGPLSKEVISIVESPTSEVILTSLFTNLMTSVSRGSLPSATASALATMIVAGLNPILNNVAEKLPSVTSPDVTVAPPTV